MTVNFYNTSSNANVVNKTLTAIKSNIDCEVFEGFSVENPRLIMRRDDSLLNCNYMYISNTNRYYFTKITVLDGNRMQVDGDVDVLKSFYNEFKDSECIANRSSNRVNNDIADNKNLQEPTVEREFRDITLSSQPFGFSNTRKQFLVTILGASDTQQG